MSPGVAAITRRSLHACGIPYAGILHWFPDFKFGSYTADRQAAWSVTGSGNYLSFGGEFPTVNGKAQQGLVRFAMPAVAPNQAKPLYSTVLDPVACTPRRVMHECPAAMTTPTALGAKRSCSHSATCLVSRSWV